MTRPSTLRFTSVPKLLATSKKTQPPTKHPTSAPTAFPTAAPTLLPTTHAPTPRPTPSPTPVPTQEPPRTKTIQVPVGKLPGQTFDVKLDGKRFPVTVPMDKLPGDSFDITIPRNEESVKQQEDAAQEPATVTWSSAWGSIRSSHAVEASKIEQTNTTLKENSSEPFNYSSVEATLEESMQASKIEKTNATLTGNLSVPANSTTDDAALEDSIRASQKEVTNANLTENWSTSLNSTAAKATLEGSLQPEPELVDYTVRIPEGVLPGQSFKVQVDDMIVTLVAPDDGKPGNSLSFSLPKPTADKQGNTSGPKQSHNETRQSSPPVPQSKEMVEYTVQIPEGVIPGQSFNVRVGDMIVTLVAPKDSKPRNSLSFSLPKPKTPEKHESAPTVETAAGTTKFVVPSSKITVSHNAAPSTPSNTAEITTNEKPPEHTMKPVIAAAPTMQHKTVPVTTRIPLGLTAGQTFDLHFSGTILKLTVPEGKKGGDNMLFDMPSDEEDEEEEEEAESLSPLIPVANSEPPKEKHYLPVSGNEPPEDPASKWLREFIRSGGEIPGADAPDIKTYDTAQSDKPVQLKVWVSNSKEPKAATIVSASTGTSKSDVPLASNSAIIPVETPSSTTTLPPSPQQPEVKHKSSMPVTTRIPAGVLEGETFTIKVAGKTITLTVPEGKKSGENMLFDMPIDIEAEDESYPVASKPAPIAPIATQKPAPIATEKPAPIATQKPVLEVHKSSMPVTARIPAGVSEGETFTLKVAGKTISLTVPEGKKSGDNMLFDLPSDDETADESEPLPATITTQKTVPEVEERPKGKASVKTINTCHFVGSKMICGEGGEKEDHQENQVGIINEIKGPDDDSEFLEEAMSTLQNPSSQIIPDSSGKTKNNEVNLTPMQWLRRFWDHQKPPTPMQWLRRFWGEEDEYYSSADTSSDLSSQNSLRNSVDGNLKRMEDGHQSMRSKILSNLRRDKAAMHWLQNFWEDQNLSDEHKQQRAMNWLNNYWANARSNSLSKPTIALENEQDDEVDSLAALMNYYGRDSQSPVANSDTILLRNSLRDTPKTPVTVITTEPFAQITLTSEELQQADVIQNQSEILSFNRQPEDIENTNSSQDSTVDKANSKLDRKETEELNSLDAFALETQNLVNITTNDLIGTEKSNSLDTLSLNNSYTDNIITNDLIEAKNSNLLNSLALENENVEDILSDEAFNSASKSEISEEQKNTVTTDSVQYQVSQSLEDEGSTPKPHNGSGSIWSFITGVFNFFKKNKKTEQPAFEAPPPPDAVEIESDSQTIENELTQINHSDDGLSLVENDKWIPHKVSSTTQNNEADENDNSITEAVSSTTQNNADVDAILAFAFDMLFNKDADSVALAAPLAPDTSQNLTERELETDEKLAVSNTQSFVADKNLESSVMNIPNSSRPRNEPHLKLELAESNGLWEDSTGDFSSAPVTSNKEDSIARQVSDQQPVDKATTGTDEISQEALSDLSNSSSFKDFEDSVPENIYSVEDAFGMILNKGNAPIQDSPAENNPEPPPTEPKQLKSGFSLLKGWFSSMLGLTSTNHPAQELMAVGPTSENQGSDESYSLLRTARDPNARANFQSMSTKNRIINIFSSPMIRSLLVVGVALIFIALYSKYRRKRYETLLDTEHQYRNNYDSQYMERFATRNGKESLSYSEIKLYSTF